MNRWVLLPKNVPASKAELTWEESYVDGIFRGDAAIVWFEKVLPRLKKQKTPFFTIGGNFSQNLVLFSISEQNIFLRDLISSAFY